MDNSEFNQFVVMLKENLQVFDSSASVPKNIAQIWFNVLSHYPMNLIRSAFDQHVMQSKFSPKPADIVEILNNMDGRPGENEAWATALESVDEEVTIVWTQETATAFSAARPILDAGDKQGAKMAFRERYTALVNEARKNLILVKWVVSRGFNKSLVNDAVNKAVIDGKLPRQEASKYLLKDESKGVELIKMITGKVEPEVNLDKWQEVRAKINQSKSFSEKREEERKREEEFRKKKKEEEVKKVDEMLDQAGF